MRAVAMGLAIAIYSSAVNSADPIGTLRQGLDLTGSVRSSYFSSSRSLDDQQDLLSGSMWLKSTPRLHSSIGMVVEAWLRNDDLGGDGTSEAKLREGYLSVSAGNIDLRAGKQIIAWGRADRMNPTDRLAPRDFRLLTPEDDDQRIGTTGIEMSYRLPAATVSGYWLPRFTPNRVPLPALAGVTYTETFQHIDQNAIRFNATGGLVDWSVSYFNGLDLDPDFEVGAVGPASVTLVMTHPRLRMIGADAATVVGRYGLRAEVAYVKTTDRDGAEPLVKNPFIYLVAGGDRTFSSYFNVNMQLYLRHVRRYRDPRELSDPLLRQVAEQATILSRQLERVDFGFSLRLANKWRHETLEAELATVYSFEYQDYAIRPKLIYAFDDHWKGTLGADIFRGPRRSFFGQWRDNSAIYFEIKYSM